MRPNLGGFAAACALSVALAAPVAEAQKPGGVLIMSHLWRDALAQAREIHNERETEYLIDTPLLADYRTAIRGPVLSLGSGSRWSFNNHLIVASRCSPEASC